jgi:uncharacterized membrane protein
VPEPGQPDDSAQHPVGVPTFSMGADQARALAAIFEQAQKTSDPSTLIAMSATVASAAFAGPLPPPEVLKGYEEVLPGSADRILKMAEGQSSHRQALETVAVNGGHRRSWWGLWLGFASTLVVMGLGAGMVFAGHDAAGASVMGIDVVGLASVFVYAQQSQRRERQTKATISQIRAPSSGNPHQPAPETGSGRVQT